MQNQPIPQTIEELREWYTAHNLPPEHVTRFFIGKNITEPRAFGIYEEYGRYIVYKNKDDGSRAVRYQGPDEAYAVRQLYERLKQEIANQKSANHSGDLTPRQNRLLITIVVAAAIAITVAAVFISLHTPDSGYYRYNNEWYYYHDGWYYYSDAYDWYLVDAPSNLNENWRDYDASYSDASRYGVTDFKSTSYWSDTDTSSSWDSSDSWDSGSTDWSSDW